MNSKTQVLLVDDDPNMLWGIGRYLTRNGYKVVSCPDGQEALEVLKESSFEIMITDIQMPRLNGLALIEWAIQNRSQMKIVAITAFGSPSVKDLLRKKGAILYFEKPFDPKALLEILEHDKNDNENSFKGNIDNIDLLDYVQMVFVTMQKLRLRIESSAGEHGLIYIDKGTATHAICGELKGEEAFYKCMSFKGGAFSSLPYESPDEITIHLKGEFLLMDAARLKDERSGLTIIRSEAPPFLLDGEDFRISIPPPSTKTRKG